MNDTVKRENRKALPKFLLIVAVAAVAGGIVGFFSALAADVGAMDRIWAGLDRLMGLIAPWGIPVTSAALLIPGFALAASARGRYAAWDQESEEEEERISTRLNWVLLLSTLALLADFFFLGTCFLYTDALFNAGFFLVSLAAVVILQQKVVDLTRRMNPEKRGSVYDVKFHKKWLDSCDEAERARIGQASYHAFRIASGVCMGLWLVLILLGFVTDIGLLPILLVVVILGVLQVSYLVTCLRMSRRGQGPAL